MTVRRLLITAVLLALPVFEAAAQTADDNAPRRAVQERFVSTGLEVGSPFPAADIFDSAGERFSTRSLKGQYTVIVNGCLT
jgi:hypothetical protein